jgi:hypothetical protein
MKRNRSILFCILLSICFFSGFAQVEFKTIVPQHPVVPGESFQVQYIVENADEISNFSPPQFSGFRVVSGPNTYDGSNSSYKNLVITLVAIKEGKFKIHGASCLINGKLLKSNDVILQVIALKGTGESSYFLAPGEDPEKKIRENLFLKLVIDKQACFIGEPLVATFKLYSRLQSKSDVIKNPGFYGFGVCDMLNVNDKVQSQEKLKGHWFDVHTIRKVQLYPLQAGIFTIDAMEIENRIEFSRSIVNKKTEQEISENMYNNESTDKHVENAEVYEMNVKTDPVNVKVKSLPVRNTTDPFAGAVGNFSIKALVEKDTILKNEENSLVIDINGAGNFQKISAPVVNWPQAIEAFDPSIIDNLDKQQVPLTGQRKFKYIFLSNKPGWYTIPAISFSFFDLKTKTYKNVSTRPHAIFVSSKSKKDRSLLAAPISTISNSRPALWFSVVSLLVLISGLLTWFITKKEKTRAKVEQKEKTNEELSQLIVIDDLLKPAESALTGNDKIFFKTLNQAVWNYFSQRFQLSGSQMNKSDLANVLTAKGIKSSTADEMIKLMQESESGVYIDVEIGLNKRELFENTKQILKEIEAGFM